MLIVLACSHALPPPAQPITTSLHPRLLDTKDVLCTMRTLCTLYHKSSPAMHQRRAACLCTQASTVALYLVLHAQNSSGHNCLAACACSHTRVAGWGTQTAGAGQVPCVPRQMPLRCRAGALRICRGVSSAAMSGAPSHAAVHALLRMLSCSLHSITTALEVMNTDPEGPLKLCVDHPTHSHHPPIIAYAHVLHLLLNITSACLPQPAAPT
eukprot:1161718-Pelagomonas_calceolata.AAC.1